MARAVNVGASSTIALSIMEIKARRTNSLVFVVLLLIALLGMLTLVSCGSEPPSTSPPADAALAVAAPKPAPDSMHVYDSTCVRLRNVFSANVDLGQGTPMLFTQQEIPWSTLSGAAPNDHWPTHGLCIEYGLQNDSMRFGIAFVQMDTTGTPDQFRYTAPDTLLDLWNGQLTANPTAAWTTAYQHDAKNTSVYFSRTRVRHKSGAAFTAVDWNSDPHMEVMAWEAEMLEMYTENANGHPDSTMYVVIDCIARPDANGDLRHNVCCHLRLRPSSSATAAYRDLMDNSRDSREMLRMHGCDFGTLCPADCGQYMIPPR